MATETRTVSRRSVQRMRAASASKRTVLIALASNATIAVAKLVGGLISGSSAMLAEAVHSVADTTNQGFLLVSIALGGREPTPDLPFGRGQERFLWAFVAAVGMFVAGAAFAVGYGLYELISAKESDGSLGIAFAILGISFVAEGTSWLRALRQTRAEAREAGHSLLGHVRGSRDPSVKLVLFEDTAALVGLVIAAMGLGLQALLGGHYWDPIGSVLIGFLLVGVALTMGRDARYLLVGRAALPEERETIERALKDRDEVTEVLELLTLVLGPNALMVAARVDLAGDLGSDEVETFASDMDDRLRELVPDVTEVFIDPTPRRR